MIIIVKMLDGLSIDIDVDENQTVAQLKEHLSERIGLASEQIRLLYKGAGMIDADTLVQHKIRPGGDTPQIHMIAQLRGGN